MVGIVYFSFHSSQSTCGVYVMAQRRYWQDWLGLLSQRAQPGLQGQTELVSVLIIFSLYARQAKSEHVHCHVVKLAATTRVKCFGTLRFSNAVDCWAVESTISEQHQHRSAAKRPCLRQIYSNGDCFSCREHWTQAFHTNSPSRQ